ncbi:hypothetical protein ASA1KI_33600 [Opitutales bacterium ASA1]|uniref:energy transducer TonB n=1 Tax=Congregicoccus parvus TaxID=3081749 RepID=UPI002B2C0F1B|nr:hypothetical protein ASA1KI_33600 [Opitutales bacterium ASA1]
MKRTEQTSAQRTVWSVCLRPTAICLCLLLVACAPEQTARDGGKDAPAGTPPTEATASGDEPTNASERPSAQRPTRAAAESIHIENTPARADRTSKFEALVSRPVDFEAICASLREELHMEAFADPVAELDWMRTQFEAGNPTAGLALALSLAYGTENLRDPDLAMAILERLVDQGHARAMTELGRLRLSSVGREANVGAALALFERAASLHDPEGIYLLATGHRLELFSESDPDKGLELLRDAAGAGHLVAAKVLYTLELGGEQTGVSADTFRMWLETNAATGDVETLMHLANHYMSAGEVDRAVSVYETAAQAGDFHAFVALLQLTGTRLDQVNVRQRVEETLRLYAESANGGGGPAAFLLAMLEGLHGPGDPRVVERVRGRLEHAVARDSHKAMVALAALDRGASLPDAFEEAIASDDGNAYLRQVEKMPNPADLEDKGMAMPRPTRTVRPIYPLELSVDYVEGIAVFDFIVGTDGNVDSIVCVEATHPAFARAGEIAIAQWKFTPGTKAGRPERMRMRVPVRFSKTE